jgi:hypothetical protein
LEGDAGPELALQEVPVTPLVHVGLFAGALALLGCSSGSGPVDPPDAGLQIRTERAGDAIAVRREEGAVILDVTSERGIGRAEILRTGASWPRPLGLRLHLGGLEELRVACGSTEVRVAVASTGDRRVSQSLRRDDVEQPITPDSPYWLDTRVVGPGSDGSGRGWIEVELAEELLSDGGDHLAIHWVDFFR